MEIKKELFGQTNDGKDVFLYTLQNQNGVEVKVSEFGGIITSVIVPDKAGNKADVVLGYDTVEPYFTNNEFFGATIGRSSNRIANASFDIDGKIITVPANEGVNNLHSDSENGFHKKLWVAAPDEGRNCVTLSYTSPDGENGFPGNLDMKVTFGLSEDNELSIHYEGISDKKTVINCTNHTYFNLAGHDSGNIEGQYLKILASKYTTVKADSIPTGECADVEGTPFDFREFHTIGERIGEDDEQLHFTGGYDHNYAVEPENGLIAVAEDRSSGRRMEVYSALPGVQFYAGNFIRDGLKGKDGAVYGKRSGFCLETQFFPNCVNEPDFEGAFYSAGNKYDYTTVYKFTTI